MASKFPEQVAMTIDLDGLRPLDLSIIIVNWNSKDYLLKSIASIEAETKGIDYEIVVIDSASFDGSEEMLRQNYPHVLFIQSKVNIGFARANNEAFKVSCGRNILFLNPDTEIEVSAINELYTHLESLPNVGIVGAKLLNSDRSVQESCIRAFPTILNQILDSDMLRYLFPKSRLWGTEALLAKNELPKEVDAVSGACMMMKRSVFENIGMFSTDYFMYSEDIDLCLKVRDAGYSTYYVPTAIIVHHGGGSSSQAIVNTFSSVMMLESRWRFFRKTRSLWYAIFYRLTIFGVCIIRIGLLLLMRVAQKLRGRRFSGGSVLKKWVARLRWAVGGENWVKRY
ncbi:glycosyltransferase family 2 protein [Methyloglobulus sp.]|uniref:glycosyltransferase family 2 protein n=1 Tax=Methyloglobulus sp. TaxID=2518622 RepID=UPI0032B84743